MRTLEQDRKQLATRRNLKESNQLRNQLDLLEVGKMQGKMKHLKWRHFKYANKSGRYLAYYLRKEKRISKMRGKPKDKTSSCRARKCKNKDSFSWIFIKKTLWMQKERDKIYHKYQLKDLHCSRVMNLFSLNLHVHLQLWHAVSSQPYWHAIFWMLVVINSSILVSDNRTVISIRKNIS